MPVAKFLSPLQQEHLQNALRESEDPHQRQRVLMLLLRNDGKTYEEIMQFIGCSYRSVAHWCVHGNPDDLESLKDLRARGNYRKATVEYIERLLVIIEQLPSELGYEFGRWTTARLALHLAKETQIQMSSVQVGRILRQKKYRYLWAKYSLEEKQDAEHRAVFKGKLSAELASTKRSPERLQVWFWDESGFSLRVIRRNGANKATAKRYRGNGVEVGSM